MEQWEKELDNALAKASPEEVLEILGKLKGWMVGYCVTCGTWNDIYGGKQGCNCPNKGEWDK